MTAQQTYTTAFVNSCMNRAQELVAAAFARGEAPRGTDIADELGFDPAFAEYHWIAYAATKAIIKHNMGNPAK